MDVKDLLPIGSIVLLKESEQRIMIIGVIQVDVDGDGREYDYSGVLYPEGYISEEFLYLFKQVDIDQILFRGFEDPEREEFLENLEKYIED